MPSRPRLPGAQLKGRGATSAPHGRFASQTVELDDEEASRQANIAPETKLHEMPVRSIISSNDSPDVPFSRSINPYIGCEHGCVYCYARPAHSYLDLSPGLDFETQIFFKPDAPARLLETWEKPGYECEPITIGANTDPYQPAEKSKQITRQLLELFARHRHPVSLITKGTLIERDLDLLSDLASDGLCSVAISIPTMNAALKRIMEPRIPSAPARLRVVQQLVDSGVPVSVLMAPVIPCINDDEIEAILAASADAGATRAAYIFLRLPHEVAAIFEEWLETHFPERAGRVMSLVRAASGGRDYDNRFGVRQTGRGAYADLLGQRFRKACKRLNLGYGEYQRGLDCSRFQHPGQRQLGLDL
jgi:DNA repair photolyase